MHICEVDLSVDVRPITIELEKRASTTLDEVVVNASRETSKVKTVGDEYHQN